MASLSRTCALALAVLLVLGGTVQAQEPGPEADEHGKRSGEAVEGAGTPGETHHGDAHHAPQPLDNWFSLSFGAGKEKQNGPFAFAILNFVVLVWLVVRFGRKPLQSFLRERHTTIRRELEDGKK